ncbi:helix-turn-helix domain-containing protein [Rhizobium sp. SGZ-381]|uniref:helix-turn-helix domain-containing protein n=1 Tax=Rhizobium sp. SGZ-381 TaxID=3342800 RepID=UPI0036712F02
MLAFDFHRTNRLRPREEMAHGTAYHGEAFLLLDEHLADGRYRRSQEKAEVDDMDAVIVSVLVQGRAALWQDRWMRLRPRDMIVLDLALATDLCTVGAHMIHMIVPRCHLPSLDGGWGTPRIYPAQVTAAKLTGNLLKTLADTMAGAGRHEIHPISSALLRLIEATLGPPAVSAVREATLARRIRRYIEDNLRSDTLTPAGLARQFAISRSQLYRIFARAGGVETYIRNRRLRRCMIALTDPAEQHRRIGEIAYALGFSDEAHFSRLFRATYGRSPRAIRQAARAGTLESLQPSRPPSEGIALLAAWLSEICSRVNTSHD